MRFDTVIVGCGTTGSMLAAYLSQDPSRTVCAIEAGRDYLSTAEMPRGVRTLVTPPPGTATRSVIAATSNDDSFGYPDWGLTARSTSRQPAIQLPRGKLVGGSSAVNGCTWLWPAREDLDAWANAGNKSWGFSDCLPYLTSLERDADHPAPPHGADGPIPVQRAHREEWSPLSEAFYRASLELGFADCPDFNSPDSWGAGPIPKNYDDPDGTGERVRYSTAIGYLIPVRDRPNLSVLASTIATRLVASGDTVRGVEVLLDGRPTLIEASEVLLTAGAVGSPQLLMLSGIGPARHLRSVGIDPLVDLPGVGQNVRDHPVLCASWSADAVPGAGSGEPSVQVALRATTPESADGHDMQLMSFRDEGRYRFGLPFSLMHAESSGQLLLTSSDPLAAPQVDFRHLEEASDRARMRSMVRLLDEMVRLMDETVSRTSHERLRPERIVPDPAETSSDSALDEWMLRNVITGHHICGTCKMGVPGDQAAVVDDAGRVHGVQNLRVVDSSVLVDCPRSNINATVMMVAEKLAAAMAEPEGSA
jgi:choline dehydrogenase